jgi:hypothetical protein
MQSRPLSSLPSLALVLLALLACKKKEEPVPSATPVSEPTPPPAPVVPAVTASAEPEPSAAATATAEPTSEPTTAKTTTTTKVTPKPSASVATKPPPSASAAPSASAPPPSTAASYAAINACCGALNAEAKKGGLNGNKYTAAAATCHGIAQQVKSGKADPAAAKTTIRAQLQGVPVPAACR